MAISGVTSPRNFQEIHPFVGEFSAYNDTSSKLENVAGKLTIWGKSVYPSRPPYRCRTTLITEIWSGIVAGKSLQMVQQTVDSKYSEHELGNSETDLATCDKQPTVSIKKPVLRDLQNNNIITVPNSIENSPLLKDRGPISNAVKVSGTKRSSPECPEIPSQEQSPNSNAANGHLVYVRRKSEVELGKSGTGDSTSINAFCPNSTQFVHQQETNQPISITKEPKGSCFQTFAPFPIASSMISSGKPSVPLPLGKYGMRLGSADSNYHPFTSSTPSLGNSKGIYNMNWEERFHQLQLILRQLDQSDQEDYHQMLRSLSSVELSRHAVELEKRSIQLSLEEAKELQRGGMLNVLGKSVKSVKVPSTQQDG